MVIFALTVVRHAETQANEKQIIQGQTDCNLTEAGVKQAEAIGQFLKTCQFTHVFCSDLGRVKKTFERIAYYQSTQLIPFEDRRLRERCYGVMEGQTVDTFRQFARDCQVSVQKSVPEGSESIEQLYQRVKAAFEHMCELMHKEWLGDEQPRLSGVYSSSALNNCCSPLMDSLSEEPANCENASYRLNYYENSLPCLFNNDEIDTAASLLQQDNLYCANQADIEKSDCVGFKGEQNALGGHCFYLQGMNAIEMTDVDKLALPSSLSSYDSGASFSSILQPFTPTKLYDSDSRTAFPTDLTDSIVADDAAATVPTSDASAISLTKSNSFNGSANGEKLRKMSCVSIASDDSLIPDSIDAHVLLVSHGGPIRELFRYFVDELNCLFPGGKEAALRQTPNTGISYFIVTVNDESKDCALSIKPSLICVYAHSIDHLKTFTY